MKTYRGSRTGAGNEVTVDFRPLPQCLEIRNHSSTGFAWGYQGSGPAQLALAILVDLRGAKFAVQWYQLFKWQVIGNLPQGAWTLTEDEIEEALARITAGAPAEKAGPDEDDAEDSDELSWEPTIGLN